MSENYMVWQKVSEKIPPRTKQILYSTPRHAFVFLTCIYRPYDRNEKYNPDYYEYELGENFFKMDQEDFWMELPTAPNKKYLWSPE